MKKRTLIKIISFSLAFFAATTGFFITMNKKIDTLRNMAQNDYSMNLYELDGSMANISTALKKAVYSSTPAQFSVLAVELATESNVAKNSLSRLPSSGQALDAFNRFLSQIGDYTIFLSKKLINGESIDEDERKNLNKLSLTAENLAHSVENIRMEYDSDGKWDHTLNMGIENAIDDSFQTTVGGLEELLADYPTLIYDGPFSDHMLKGSLKMLEGKAEVTVNEALNKAAEILNLDAATLKSDGESSGSMPCFNFSNQDMTVSVTKRGGFVAFMRKFREVLEQKIDYNEAVKIAENYLNENSDGDFVSTYYFADEGVCTVNLVYKEGATLCYPDLIKIGVALDSGEVVFVEAAGYLANHHIRTIDTPRYSVEEAETVLSDALKPKSVRRAIIPTTGNNEKHCYEFLCTGINDEEILVYINVSTLLEEQILIVLATDGGTLTK